MSTPVAGSVGTKPEASYYQQFLYVSSNYFPEIVIFRNPPPSTWTSCVNTAKAILGKSGSWGDAGKIVPDISVRPAPGVVGITNEGPGHVFVIKEVSGGVLSVIEGNLIAGQVSTRSINIDDPRIKGYRKY